MSNTQGQARILETPEGKEEALYFQLDGNEHWVRRYLNQGRYEIRGLVAVGGFGCVFVAVDRWNYNKEVVIKTPFYMGEYCRPFITRSQEAFEKQIVHLNKLYDWEQKHLSGFSNAGFNSIVNINDYFKDRSLDLSKCFRDAAGVQYRVAEKLRESAPYIVMKFIRGQMLKNIIQHHALSELETLQIARQLLVLMRYLHKERKTKKGFPFYYLLCDLKAENIMICDEQVVLIDFGAVKIYHLDIQEVDVPIFVTDGYAAPEVYSGSIEFRDNPKIDSRFDLFTVGALMVHCLTGRHPQTFLTNHAPPQHDFSLEAFPHISMDIKNIINKATNKDRRTRYADAEAMLEDVMNCWHQLEISM